MSVEQAVAQWNAYSSKTWQRDKILRLVDFTVRFVNFYASDPEQAALLSRVSGVIKSSRKFLRLGRWLEFLQVAVKASRAHMNAPERTFTIGKSLGMGGWLVWDNILFLRQLGVLEGDKKQALERGAQFWACGMLCAVLLDLYQLGKHLDQAPQKHVHRLDGASSTSSEESHRAKKHSLMISLARNVLDLTVPLSILGFYVPVLVPHNGAVALNAMISSCITIWLGWPSSTHSF